VIAIEIRNIGAALSGGGIRAMVFHLGFFKWLAEHGLFEQVRKISTVSGASLCVGMVYAHSNLVWPTSEIFLSKTLPSITDALKTDLQLSALLMLPFSPQHWNKRVNIIAKALERKWGVSGNLSQLSGNVMWYVNCTTFETGKRFRFCQDDMGDYILGYVKKPNISVSNIMAASAGFPIGIGPYALKTGDFTWEPPRFANENWKPPGNRTVHLWDGGVYDNLGLESVFKQDDGGKLSDGVEYLIISNASSPLQEQARHKLRALKNTKRLLDISADQVSALRTRSVMDFIKDTKQGMYLKIGNSADAIAQKSKCSKELHSQIVSQCLPTEKARRAMEYKTTLRRPSNEDFRLLLQHGYEVADCTFHCYDEKKG